MIAPARSRSSPSALPTLAPTARRAFRCRCGRPVFFHNDVCLACDTPLGFDPDLGLVRPLARTSDPAALRALRARGDRNAPLLRYRRCAHAGTCVGCTWLLPDDAMAMAQPYCRSCRLNRTVPDPGERDNARLWHDVERAKRELVAQLIALKLPVASRVSEDPGRGLMFDLLRSPIEGPRVMTGHDDGLITLDIEEADHVHRERQRQQMHELYRTLIGHLRHETGHYYWQRLVQGTPWEPGFRALFGDESADYGLALQAYYANGAPADWNARHVSEYASSHPHEDWAETWAHYLHLVDGLETARAFGLAGNRPETGIEPFGAYALDVEGEPDAEDVSFLAAINGWIELSVALNQLTSSMGEPDFYPFVLSVPAVRKLHFVHKVVMGASRQKPAPGGVPLAPASEPAAV